MPRIETRIQLVLLILQRELRKKTNTGGLAARCLIGSEMHVVGVKGAPVDFGAVVAPAATHLLLFPAEHAQPLDGPFCASLRGPVRLIVPDGNWKQAERLRRELPTGAAKIDVCLAKSPASRYGLRRRSAAHPEGLATLEAIAYALEALDGPLVSAPLLKIFSLFVARTREHRGIQRQPGSCA